MHRVLFGLAGLAVLVAAGVTWLMAGFDGDRWKTVAADWLQQERQRSLTIDGPIRLELLPRLQIVAHQVRLSERFKPEDEFLVVDEAAFEVDLVPLLADQAVIRSVHVRGLRVELERGVDGLGNADDLLAMPGIGAIKLEVQRTVIEDARATVRDARWPLDGEIRFEHLELGRFGRELDAPVSLRASLALQQPPVAGSVDGEFTLGIGVPDSPLRIDAARLHFRGSAAGLRELDAALAGRLRIDAAHDRIEADEARLELQARGDGWQLGSSSLRAAQLRYQSVGGAIAWSGLEAEAQGRLGGQQPFTLRLDAPQFGLNDDQVAGRGVKLRFELGGELPLTVALESRPPSGRSDQIRLPGLRGEFRAGGETRRLEGSANGDAWLRLATVKAGEPRLGFDRLELRGRFEPGSGNPGWPMTARGSLGMALDSLRWNLNGTLADDACAAEGQALSQPGTGLAPKLVLRLRCDRLDLGRWQRLPASPDLNRASRARDAATSSDTWRALDAQLSLRAAQLQLDPVSARDARLDATLGQGVLKVQSLQAKVWDGSVELSGTAEDARPGQPPSYELELDASGVDVGRMFGELDGLGGLQGRGQVTARLNARGRDLPALRQALRGEARLVLRDGAVIGADLTESLKQPPERRDRSADVVGRGQPDSRTPFQTLQASFRIVDGVASSDDLELRSGHLQIAGEGRVDLGRQRIQYSTRAQVPATRAAASARTRPPEADPLAAMRGLSVPVQLSGPFDAVDWRIRWSETTPLAAPEADPPEAGSPREPTHASAPQALAVSPATALPIAPFPAHR